MLNVMMTIKEITIWTAVMVCGVGAGYSLVDLIERMMK